MEKMKLQLKRKEKIKEVEFAREENLREEARRQKINGNCL